MWFISALTSNGLVWSPALRKDPRAFGLFVSMDQITCIFLAQLWFLEGAHNLENRKPGGLSESTAKRGSGGGMQGGNITLCGPFTKRARPRGKPPSIKVEMMG